MSQENQQPQPVAQNANIATTVAERNSFAGLLAELMDTIGDAGFENRAFTEGEFLNAMNILKKLHALRGNVATNTIYVYIQEQLARAPRAPPRAPPSLAQKLQDPRFISCPRCDRTCQKKKLDRHQMTAVCKQGKQSKKTSVIKEAETSDWHQIQQVLMRQCEVTSERRQAFVAEIDPLDRAEPALDWIREDGSWQVAEDLGYAVPLPFALASACVQEEDSDEEDEICFRPQPNYGLAKIVVPVFHQEPARDPEGMSLCLTEEDRSFCRSCGCPFYDMLLERVRQREGITTCSCKAENSDTDSVISHDDFDDHGVMCHYSRTTGGWEPTEPFCVGCGYGSNNCVCVEDSEDEEDGYDSDNEPLQHKLDRAIALSLATKDDGYDSEDEPIGTLLVRQNAVRK